ncbi:MAG: epoxyqueuosine reductase QueH [Bacilli bacterium]|nr:epoxyqueuosine reductase QueH [Bacilli bacterium]
MNYQLQMDQIISEIIKENRAPKLLLHSCCAPCSSYVLEYLSNYFEITVFYYNPNITDEKEYNRRVIEQKKFIDLLQPYHKISYIEGDYEPSLFLSATNNFKNEKEGGARCEICYGTRLENTAKKAAQLGYDYFTTTLSISPYKNALLLNQIGEKLEQKYQVKYLYADFKKKNGYKRSIILSKKYNLYRQDYCGCSYSKKEMLERRNIKEEKC